MYRTLEDLVNLALASPKIGMINCFMLHTLLHAIIEKLDIADSIVKIPDTLKSTTDCVKKKSNSDIEKESSRKYPIGKDPTQSESSLSSSSSSPTYPINLPEIISVSCPKQERKKPPYAIENLKQTRTKSTPNMTRKFASKDVEAKKEPTKENTLKNPGDKLSPNSILKPAHSEFLPLNQKDSTVAAQNIELKDAFVNYIEEIATKVQDLEYKIQNTINMDSRVEELESQQTELEMEMQKREHICQNMLSDSTIGERESPEGITLPETSSTVDSKYISNENSPPKSTEAKKYCCRLSKLESELFGLKSFLFTRRNSVISQVDTLPNITNKESIKPVLIPSPLSHRGFNFYDHIQIFKENFKNISNSLNFLESKINTLQGEIQNKETLREESLPLLKKNNDDNFDILLKKIEKLTAEYEILKFNTTALENSRNRFSSNTKIRSYLETKGSMEDPQNIHCTDEVKPILDFVNEQRMYFEHQLQQINEVLVYKCDRWEIKCLKLEIENGIRNSFSRGKLFPQPTQNVPKTINTPDKRCLPHFKKIEKISNSLWFYPERQKLIKTGSKKFLTKRQTVLYPEARLHQVWVQGTDGKLYKGRLDKNPPAGANGDIPQVEESANCNPDIEPPDTRDSEMESDTYIILTEKKSFSESSLSKKVQKSKSTSNLVQLN
ncbi:hypothetical protein Ahia01_000355100 [Argonauta hians]